MSDKNRGGYVVPNDPLLDIIGTNLMAELFACEARDRKQLVMHALGRAYRAGEDHEQKIVNFEGKSVSLSKLVPPSAPPAAVPGRSIGSK